MTENKKGKSRGRPRTTSREKIIAEVVKMLAEDPEQAITINGVARYMGLAPMGLYSYFTDIDDLHRAVAAYLLGKLNVRIGAEDSWQDQLQTWGKTVRRFFLKHPYLMNLIGWKQHIASGWLRQIALLVRILKLAGYEGDELARVTIWTSKVLVGAVWLEIGERRTRNALNEQDITALNPEDKQLLAELAPQLTATTPSREFDYCLDRCISSLGRE